MNELELLEDADRRAREYIANAPGQAVFPKAADVVGLARFNEPLSAAGRGDAETLALLDEAGSPATAVSNGARYFGFVIGATLPVAAAAERMSLAWDQCASSDGAMGICRDAAALAGAMNSDADYAQSTTDSQRNLGLEFSRRARGIAVWAALRSLGRDGVASLVSGNAAQAKRLATGLADGGFDILNRVVLNQVLFRLHSPAATLALRQAAVATGDIWFGSTRWQGQPALRLSVSSWRTTDDDVDAAIRLLCDLKTRLQQPAGGAAGN